MQNGASFASRVPRLLLASLLALLSGLPAAGGADRWNPVASPEDLEAAYVFNVIKFTEWPEDALPEDDGTVVLAVLGEDPAAGALGALEGREVQQRAIHVVRFRTPEELGPCHVLFVGMSEKTRLPEVLARLDGARVLTVAAIPGFARLGGVVGLERTATRLVLEVNLEAAAAAELKVSLQLLRVARVVGTGKARGPG